MHTFLIPSARWEGEDAFVVGGGPSLKGFDWSLLRGRNVIGCNEAFRHGADIVGVTFLSDARWCHARLDLLDKYVDDGGEVFTHCAQLSRETDCIPWLQVAKRRIYGLHRDALSYGHSSGPGAINLALLFGAARVFLLGFDCKINGSANWHNHYDGFNSPKYVPPFFRIIRGFNFVARDLPKVFPDRKIVNLGPDSELTCFPKMNFDEVLKTEGALCNTR